jgi:hypothetical protein
MTPGDGFLGMDRFALDTGTAERLVTGAVDVGDAPPEYRAVAVTLQALREPPESLELAGDPAVVERIAAMVVAERAACGAPRPRRLASRARAAVASFAVFGLALSGSLASAGALPEPAQRVASAALNHVGISVPTGDNEPVEHKPVPTTAIPKPTPAASVQSNPTPVSPSTPPPVPHGASVTAPAGPGQEHARAAPAPSTLQPTAPADAEGPSPSGPPPGNGNGNGNAYGNAKGGENANGYGNGNAYGKVQASGTASVELSLDGSVVLAIGHP